MLPLALRGPAGGGGAVGGMSARVDPKLGESKFNLGVLCLLERYPKTLQNPIRQCLGVPGPMGHVARGPWATERWVVVKLSWGHRMCLQGGGDL
ncbi:unnamed protein product [Gadus morhua 'NCC']